MMGQVLHRLRVFPRNESDDVIEQDIILVWALQRRIITGADILGRLLRGITLRGTDAASIGLGKHDIEAGGS